MNIFATRCGMLVVFMLALALVLSGAAQAAQLFTPSLEPAEGNRLDCRILNVSDQNQTVRTRVVDNGGTPLVDTGDFTLGAGATAVANITESDTDGLHPRHCHFTVGAKSKFRGSACVFQDGVGCTAAVPAQ